jgi:uncharacterized protein with HEPN domain
MFDKDLAIEVLKQIEIAVERILTRFQPIRKVSDFTDSPEGMEKMDAICMMLIVIGESLKNLDKITGGILLENYPQVEWKKAKGMRDILTHRYPDVDAEAVFYTCKEKIPDVGKALRKMLDDLS